MTDNFKIQGVYFFDESKCKEEYKDGCTSNTYNCSTALESVVDAKYFADPDSYFGGEKKGQRIEFAYDGKIYYGKIDEKKSEVQFYLKGTTDTEIGSPVKYNPGAGEIYLVAIQEKETSNPEFAFQYDKSRIDEYIEDKLSKLARLGRNKTYEKKTKKTKKVGAPFMLFELNSGYSTRPERPSSSYMSEHVKGVKLNEDGGPFNRDGWMFDIGIGRDFLPNLEHDLIVDGHAGYAAGAERFFVGGPSLRYRWNFIPRWLGIELGVIDMVQLASDQPHVAGFNFATQALVTFYPVRNDKFEMGINAGWRGELYNTARYDFSDSGWSGEANALVFGLEFRGVRKDKEYDHSETLNCSNNPIKPYVHVNEAGDASVVEYKQGDVKIDIKLINFHPPLVIQSKETTPLFTWSTDDVKRVTVTNPKAEYEPYAMKDISRDIFISLTKLAGDYIKAGRNKNEAYIVIDGFAWVGAGGEGRANYDLTWEMASHAMIKYPHERGPEMKGQPDTLMDWLMVKDRLFKGGMPKIDGVTIKSVKDFTQEDYDNYPDADKEKIEAAYNQGRFLKIQAVNERTGEAFTAVLEFRPRGVGERPDIPDAAIKNRALDAAEGNIRNELKTGDYAVHYQRVMRRFTSADGTIDEATINKLPKDQKIELVRRIVLEAHTKKIEAEYDDEGSVSSELWRDYDMQHYSHSLFPWNKDKPNGWEHGKHSNGIEIKIRASQPEKQEGYEYLYEGRLETNSAALADIYQTRFSIANSGGDRVTKIPLQDYKDRGRPGKETTRPYLQHFAKETEGSYIVLVVNRLHDASVLEADAIKKDKFFAKKIGEYVSVRRPEGAGSVKVGYMQNPYMAEGIYLLEFSYEPNEYNVQKNLESAAVWEHFKSSDRNPDAEPVSGDIDLGEDTEVSTGTTLKVANAGNVRVSAPRPVVPVVPLAPVDTRSDEVKLTEKSVAPAPVVRSEPVARPEPVVPPVLADTRSDDQKLAELKERSQAFKALCDAKNPDKKTLTDRYNELKELIKKTVFSDQAIKDMVDSFTPVLDNQFREASLQI